MSGFDKLCLFNWVYENVAYLWEAAGLAVSDLDMFIVDLHDQGRASSQKW